ncbi:MAG TPA: beta-1,6-N-acetylglucosaminyltransferase [Flavisolibacter sp.]|nr:beta-1,6-N-acetylglucosaminyltransferase [Flavisolibacter sp.]
MDVNYIIVAHSQPALVSRLIRRLRSDNARFYVHIDKHQDLKEYSKEFISDGRVYFLNERQRQRVNWGDDGMFKGILAALQQIIDEKRNGYCVLLSGQDYPIKSNEQIETFFEKRNGTNFITYGLLPWTGNLGWERVSRYKVDVSEKRGDYVYLPSVWEREFYQTDTAKKLFRLFRNRHFRFAVHLLHKRKFPSYLKPYAGPSWWALPVSTVKQVLQFVQGHADYVRFHKFTFVPDEAFFQPIVLHLHESGQTGSLAPMLTYVDWTRPSAGMPAVLRAADLQQLMDQPDEILFARKFSLDTDTRILDLIDQQLFSEIPAGRI